MTILLTAFEPFGGETINPAQEALAVVPSEVAGTRIIKMEVPVVFGKAIETVIQAMEREKPDAVLCVGQAGGRAGITPERVAINIDDARIPDNAGNQPVDTPIFPDGAPAYFSSLPVKDMVRIIQEAGLPATISNTAGTYVCNHLMYGVLYHIDKFFPGMKGGFMHVPFMHEQVMDKLNTPSLSREEIARGIEAALQAIAHNLMNDGIV